MPPDQPKAKPAHPVLPVGPGYQPTSFLGRVESLGAEQVTIKPERVQLERNLVRNSDGGIQEERLYVQDNTQPPKTFTFEDSLLAFDKRLVNRKFPVVHHTARLGEHRISDLRVGDIVYISYRPIAGTEFCIRINILRRPGGAVPPAVGDEDITLGRKVVTRQNAEQFAEETIAGKWGPRILHSLKK